MSKEEEWDLSILPTTKWLIFPISKYRIVKSQNGKYRPEIRENLLCDWKWLGQEEYSDIRYAVREIYKFHNRVAMKN